MAASWASLSAVYCLGALMGLIVCCLLPGCLDGPHGVSVPGADVGEGAVDLVTPDDSLLLRVS